MMEPTAPARARIAAAAILLDRGWGKPKETLVTEGSEDRGPLRIVREIVHVNETQEAIESEDLVVDFSEIKQINGNGSNGHRE